RPDRTGSLAGYNYQGAVPEGLYDPASQPAEFLFWQCREAALAAIDTWEAITGGPFKTWEPGKKIDLVPDAGTDANPFYDRVGLNFFDFTTGGETFFSGASTDVVSHEAGHGFLDSVRPDLWNSAVFEHNSFHEAFADCIAILTALRDKPTRAVVLASVANENI